MQSPKYLIKLFLFILLVMTINCGGSLGTDLLGLDANLADDPALDDAEASSENDFSDVNAEDSLAADTGIPDADVSAVPLDGSKNENGFTSAAPTTNANNIDDTQNPSEDSQTELFNDRGGVEIPVPIAKSDDCDIETVGEIRMIISSAHASTRSRSIAFEKISARRQMKTALSGQTQTEMCTAQENEDGAVIYAWQPFVDDSLTQDFAVAVTQIGIDSQGLIGQDGYWVSVKEDGSFTVDPELLAHRKGDIVIIGVVKTFDADAALPDASLIYQSDGKTARFDMADNTQAYLLEKADGRDFTDKF